VRVVTPGSGHSVGVVNSVGVISPDRGQQCIDHPTFGTHYMTPRVLKMQILVQIFIFGGNTRKSVSMSGSRFANLCFYL